MHSTENNNHFSHQRGVIHNEDEAKLTLLVAFGTGLITVGGFWLKSRIGGNEKIRQHKKEKEIDINYYKAKTEWDMKRKSSSPTSEDKNLSEGMGKVMDEFGNKQDHNASSSEGIDLNAFSSADLFNRTSCTYNSKWIVDGFMKKGLVNLLVAGSNTGKSILMTQIALAVAKGKELEFLPNASSPSVKLPVIYYRLEDFAGELEGKYGDGKVLFESGIQWFLPEHLPQNNLKGFVEHLKHLASTLTKDTLVCIDPATKLDGYNHSDFIKGVEEAMAVAKSFGFVLTIIASIHLDEIPDWKYLSLDHIKGGDQAIQKAGSVTAIRKERTGEDYRYLQCLKEPKGHRKPFKGEVLVCRVVEKKLDDNNKYLHYEYFGTKKEEIARPEKPKLQQDDTLCDSPQKPSNPPALKITPDVEAIIREGIQKGLNVKEISKDVKKRTKVKLSVDYLRKYIKKIS